METYSNTTFDYKQKKYRPSHHMAAHLLFETKKQAHLADAIAREAEANGIGVNEFTHIIPAIFRILKSESVWAQ